MRVLRLAEEEIWVDTEPEALAAARRHLEMYKIGREVEVEDVTEARALLSLIGPRSAELAGSPPLPEYASEELSVDGIECLAVGTALGIDLIAPRRGRGAPARCPGRGRRGRGRPRGGRDPPHRGRDAALRRRDGLRDDARRGRHRRGRGQLREGLLHRPGDGRPPPLPGQAEPAPARPAAERSAAPGAALLRWARRRSAGSAAAASPPLHGPIALAILRREAEPGAELAVGEDGVTARVVDLPFG